MSEKADFCQMVGAASSAIDVAVVGAGLSGLACARTLVDHGCGVRVFDKARGPGGRMSTRRSGDWRFDHGAQYFTVRDPGFSRWVDSWLREGLVEKWDGTIAVLDQGDIDIKDDTTDRYVGVPAMNAICRHFASGLEVSYESEVAGLEPLDSGWRLIGRSRVDLGRFDAVVVSAPAAQTARLLGPAAAGIGAPAASVEMAACWAVMLGSSEPLGVEFDGAFVTDSPLSWVARNASKPGRPRGEAWVLHATPEWSQQHLEIERGRAARLLFDAFVGALGGLDVDPVHLAAHRWRYALPIEPLVEPCLFDAELKIAACGDWCGGPRVEGAFLSGIAAGNRIFDLNPR